jgi:hypothetical protein
LKSRVAELVDLAAYRAGLQRIRREGAVAKAASVKAEAATEVG